MLWGVFMKRAISLLVVLVVAAAAVFTVIFFVGSKQVEDGEKIALEQYYSMPGIQGKIYGCYLVVYDGDLKVIDLNSKSVIKNLEIPGKKVLGFDIYEDKLVWSDLRNEKDTGKLNGSLESSNSDIFIYDIKKDSISQITTNTAAQTSPVIWGNYIAWQDNRDDGIVDNYPEWNIYLYDIEKKSEKRITKEAGVHTNCRLNNNRLIWEDGRYAKVAQSERFNYELPSNNTDIYMYDINEDRYQPIAYGRYQECRPDINKDSIVWEDRNNFMHNADISIYDISSYKVKNLTKDNFNQIKPCISEDIAAWVDERRGTEEFTGIPQERNGNSDICIYDLKTGKESLIEEEGVQTDCSASPSYIVYTSKMSEKESSVKVVKYERKLQG